MKTRMVLAWCGAACLVVGGVVSVGALAGDGDEKKDDGVARRLCRLRMS